MAEDSNKSQSTEKKPDTSGKRDPSYAAATHDTDLMKPQAPPNVKDEELEITGHTDDESGDDSREQK